MPTPIPDYYDEFGLCPRCGRRMNDERVPDADGLLTSFGGKGLWGYMPRRLGMPPQVFVARECGDGWHFIPRYYYRPDRDEPGRRWFKAHHQPAFTREGAIYGEIDQEVGF